MKVGDIITKDRNITFNSMNAGSVIKILKHHGSSDRISENYIMRLNQESENSSGYQGVCILSNDSTEGSFWGGQLNGYHYEIIKLT